MSRWTRTGATLVATALVAGLAGPLSAQAAVIVVSPASSGTVTGVDVSSWQHPNGKASDIAWSKVAAAGHDFAIIKATESNTYKNPYYASDVAAARSAGMVVGAYHFARPKLPLSSAVTQAKYFVATTGKMRTTKTLPPVLDIEATGGLSKANTVAWAKSFLTTVRSLTGRTPMIYSYDNFLRTSLANTTSLKSYPLWYAKYSTSPPGALPGGWNTWTIWQYTSQATVSGLKGDIDVNRFNGTLDSLVKLADGTKAAPISPGAPTALTPTLNWPDAQLQWSAPTSTGGSAITNYVVTVDGFAAGSTPTRSFVAGPLTVGSHTFSVRAVTIAGTGPAATTTVVIPTPPPGTPAAPAGASALGLTTATTASRGIATAVTVTLRRADTRQTVAGQPITVTVTPKKGPKTTVKLTTNTSGAATTVVTHRTTGTLSVKFAGSARLTSTSSSVTVKVRPRPLVKLTKTTVKRGATTYLKGNVSKYYKGEKVKRQLYYGKKWHTVSTVTVSSTGTYSFRINTKTRTTYKFRVHVDASKLHLAGNSKTVKLRVK